MVAICLTLLAAARDQGAGTRQQPQHAVLMAAAELWGVFTIQLAGPDEGSCRCNPFVDVNLTATFTHVAGHTLSGAPIPKVTATGFYDSAGLYVVRWMPQRVGVWRYETASNVATLSLRTGSVQVRPTTSPWNNGGVARAVNGSSTFVLDSGQPFVPLGTTCYAWLHQPEGDALEQTTLASLKASPFNKVRMVVFPKWYKYTHREPRFYPYESQGPCRWKCQTPSCFPPPPGNCSWDFSRFNTSFWRHLEGRVGELLELGIVAELILFHPYDGGHWGFDRMNVNCAHAVATGVNGSWCDDHYLRYVVARLSAFRNVWWSMANEFDGVRHKTIADWDRLFVELRTRDPYNHERSIHNGRKYYNHSRPWVTHVSLQGHAVSQLAMAKEVWTSRTPKPIVWDEVEYEGNISSPWGNVSGFTEAQRGWEALMNGAFMGGHSSTQLLPLGVPGGASNASCTDGHPSYPSCNAVMWWNKGLHLHGESARRLGFMASLMANSSIAGFPAKSGFAALQTACFGTASAPVYLLGQPGWYIAYWAAQASDTGAPQASPNVAPAVLGPVAMGVYTLTLLDYWNMTLHTLPKNVTVNSTGTLAFTPQHSNCILILQFAAPRPATVPNGPSGASGSMRGALRAPSVAFGTLPNNQAGWNRHRVPRWEAT